MSPLDKLEKKWRWLAKPDLMLICVICCAVGFVLAKLFPLSLMFLCFEPRAILHGQVWRLLTFLVYPNGDHLFLEIILCYCYYSIARSLSSVIGRFKVNFFLLLGIIILDIMGFLYYFIMPGAKIEVVALNPEYLYAMLFALFAMCFPDARFLFMLFIPIQGKWMIFLTFVLYLLDVMQYLANGSFAYAWILICMVIAAVLTLIIFLRLINFSTKKSRTFRRTQKTFRKMESGAASASTPKTPRHRCAICGRTDLSNPELDFRYCSRCAGNYEYCLEHLYTHVHVTDPSKNPEL